MRKANERGQEASWDCYEFMGSTNKRRSVTKRKSPLKIFTGPRGGKYYLVRNKKVYL
jgi:hypothetical protein